MRKINSQLNILLITEHWLPQRGGIQRYLAGLAQHLHSQPGADVSIVAPEDRKIENGKCRPAEALLRRPKLYAKALAKAGKMETLRTTRKRFFWPLIKPTWLPLFIHAYRRVQRENIDVILCGKALFEGLLAQMIKKYLKVPYVVFTYAMEIEEWASKPGTRRKLERVLRDADRIVNINEITRKKLISLGATEKQLVKIQPGVTPLLLEEGLGEVTGSAIRKRYGITKPYIVSVGRLIPRKGFDDLIRGFAQYSKDAVAHTQLVIVGDGPEKEKLEKLAEELSTPVQFLGEIPDAELANVLQEADLFALTPKSVNRDMEGFGIVYLEAALAGLPSIGTKHGGVPEAVANGETGILVEENAPEQIASALGKLLEDNELREKLGSQAKTRVEGEFSWKHQTALANNMIRDIIAGS